MQKLKTKHLPGWFWRGLKKTVNYLIFLLIAINLVLAGAYLYLPSSKYSPSQQYPELAILAKKDLGLKSLQDFFTNVAQTKGAVYAYELLKIAPIAENVDLHLLAHTVGDELYKQKGLDGMLLCGHEFRNACSHTIVIGEFIKNGDQSLGEINKMCQKAPGGKGAYAMCYHGLGHGIFAYTGYDLPEAMKICQKTESQNPNGREYLECVGGVIMELTGGGDHDRELWKEQSAKYLTRSNPLGPCNTNLIPSKVKRTCYVYLTPHLFEMTGAKNSHPSDESLKKSFSFCEKIPANEKENIDICYTGFGKEFVVLAKDRDIRNISDITLSQLQQIVNWCLLAGNELGIKACFGGAISSLYWGGENPVDPAVDLCKIVPDEYQSYCFSMLNKSVQAYVRSDQEYKDFCKLLPAKESICDEKN